MIVVIVILLIVVFVSLLIDAILKRNMLHITIYILLLLTFILFSFYIGSRKKLDFHHYAFSINEAKEKGLFIKQFDVINNTSDSFKIKEAWLGYQYDYKEDGWVKLKMVPDKNICQVHFTFDSSVHSIVNDESYLDWHMERDSKYVGMVGNGWERLFHYNIDDCNVVDTLMFSVTLANGDLAEDRICIGDMILLPKE